MRKTAFLIGLALTVFSIIRTLLAYTPWREVLRLKVLPEIFEGLTLIALMGVGLALIAYATLSRRKLLWLVLLMVSFISVIFILSPPIGRPISSSLRGPLLPIFIILAMSSISTVILYLKTKPIFKAISIALLVVLMVFFMNLDMTTEVMSRLKPYDIPLRDEMYTELGWTHCGDFYIDPNPWVAQKVSWRKALHENESIACYFRIKIANSDRPWEAEVKYTIRYRLKCLRPVDVFAIYEASRVFSYVPREGEVPAPYNTPNPNAVEVTEMSEGTSATQRIDVLTSYRGYPSYCPGEVSFDVEIRLLWKM